MKNINIAKRIKNLGFIQIMILICFHLMASEGNAQYDTIKLPATGVLQIKNLKPGLREYIIYTQFPNKPKSFSFWLWKRNTQIEERNGENVFVTKEVWTGEDTTSYREYYSINRMSDFAPIYKKATIKNKTHAYNWEDRRIVRSDSVPNNAVELGFKLDFNEPVLNWHMDIETFEMLPLGPDKVFAINFYDAGQQPPKYNIYNVTGEERVSSYDGKTIDCWVLNRSGINGNGKKFSQTFWISKKTHEFIKEEDNWDGVIRHKIKLPSMPIEMPIQ
ncbi:DUF3108 domain-containing protein [Galbibacter pacificus]|uniref:Uncharacterized protein n=1 Tax=Galbibacter pacificus TaxID=2996052 RepID=A0ABT6FQZ5_9FLAO|nr:hypothetical protein [Galbibacter pacificus]MDG3581837.1 hypothetical protein [Galbibacter pacificus]MDG3585689.1 hypothetical protein [Galbibacter pacificus]